MLNPADVIFWLEVYFELKWNLTPYFRIIWCLTLSSRYSLYFSSLRLKFLLVIDNILIGLKLEPWILLTLFIKHEFIKHPVDCHYRASDIHHLFAVFIILILISRGVARGRIWRLSRSALLGLVARLFSDREHSWITAWTWLFCGSGWVNVFCWALKHFNLLIWEVTSIKHI